MCTIYENIKNLCDGLGIKPGKMCTEIGISKSILTGLKNGTKKNIQTDTAQKIADYFGVPVDRVLSTEQKENLTEIPGEVSEKDIRLLNWFRSLPVEKQRAILVSQDAPEDVL